MSKGRESDPHRVMSEAFALRLNTLFSESTIHQGKVIRPVGLKPDVYVAHPDGRQWAYEVVHLNKSLKEIQEKHHRYQAAGIRDYWILWDDPHPTDTSFSMSQGVLLQESDSVRQVGPLGKLSKVIYSTHAEYFTNRSSVLYAFDYFKQLIDNQQTPEFMKAMAFGIRVYSVQEYATDRDYLSVMREIISLPELGFDQNGLLIQARNTGIDNELLEKMFQGQGFGGQGEPFIPEEALNQINRLVSDPARQAELLPILLQAMFGKLPPDELAEIRAFGENGGLADLKQIDLSDLSVGGPVSIETGDGLVNVAQLMKIIDQRFQVQNMPPALMRVFSTLFQSGQIQALGETMQWTETSDAAQRLMKKE